jgi:hypothetical protein
MKDSQRRKQRELIDQAVIRVADRLELQGILAPRAAALREEARRICASYGGTLGDAVKAISVELARRRAVALFADENG